MYLSGLRLQVHQSFLGQHPADIDESPPGSPEESASTGVLAHDLKGEAELHLANLTAAPD